MWADFINQVIVFLGDFSSSTSAHRGTSVIDGHQRRFGELGTFLCAPELNIGQESVVSLVDLAHCQCNI